MLRTITNKNSQPIKYEGGFHAKTISWADETAALHTAKTIVSQAVRSSAGGVFLCPPWAHALRETQAIKEVLWHGICVFY